MDFVRHYHIAFINPSSATICYFITYLTQCFTSAKCMHNYMSGVWFLHRQLGWRHAPALESYPVACLLTATGLNIRAQPLRWFPVLHTLLHQLCSLADSLGLLGPSMIVCLIVALFRMLRQPSTKICWEIWPLMARWGDIIMAPPGVLMVVRWTKTLQCVGSSPLLPIAAVYGHLTDPVAAYQELLATSPTISPISCSSLSTRVVPRLSWLSSHLRSCSKL